MKPEHSLDAGRRALARALALAIAGVAAGGAALAPVTALAQGYPSRPVKMAPPPTSFPVSSGRGSRSRWDRR